MKRYGDKMQKFKISSRHGYLVSAMGNSSVWSRDFREGCTMSYEDFVRLKLKYEHDSSDTAVSLRGATLVEVY